MATVELRYTPECDAPPAAPVDRSTASATCDGPAGWQTTVVVRLTERVARLVPSDRDTSHLTALLEVLPAAAGATIAPLRRSGAAGGSDSLDPAFRRALRDAFAIELLAAPTHLNRPPVAPGASTPTHVRPHTRTSGCIGERHRWVTPPNRPGRAPGASVPSTIG
ncbi:MAG: hypothetical protein U5K30_03410 [Acidimicrobiales bacterium]|nr:hypothetical protein [Acidimicrobiales bacterium]